MPKEDIEELRFEIIKKILDEFPELRERLREYLREDGEKKEATE